MEFDGPNESRSAVLLHNLKRFRLLMACVVIVLCFALGNDVYAAKKVAERHKDLLNGARHGRDYSAAARRMIASQVYHSDLKKRFLIDPKSTKQKNMMEALAFQADVCNQNTSFITALPFTDSGTTVGATDDYDLSGDPTNCPSPTCEATSGSFQDRGYTYAGSGTGPDVAYKIAFIQPTSLQITVDPSDAPPNADDLNVTVYASNCSNSPSDAIVMADNSGDGNPPDLADNSETVTFTLLPAGIYNIVIDGYTASGDPLTAGPYTINVSCVASMLCSTPGYRSSPRRNP